MTVTGTEQCCFIGPESAVRCENVARWCIVDGRPAFDNYTEVCDAHIGEFAGEVFPLIAGQEHPTLVASAALVRESEERHG